MKAEVIAVPTGLITVPDKKVAKYPGLTVIAPFVVCAYLVRTPDTTVFFDTGISTTQEGIDWYAPRVYDIVEQLNALDVERGDVDLIVNCHMHCDHAGGNYLFPGTPVVVQRRELKAARVDDYTVSAACFSYERAVMVEIDGAYQIDPSLRVLATPGHSPGHQSMIIEDTTHGRMLLAGQAFDSASEYGAAVLARHVSAEYDNAAVPTWVDDLVHPKIDVARFAHDMAQWRPDPVTFTNGTTLRAWEDARAI